MSAAEPAGTEGVPSGHPAVAALIPVVRRVVGARVADHTLAEDLVQETLARVLAAEHRVGAGMLESYAIATARNLVASTWQLQDRHRRNQHRVVDLRVADTPDEDLVAREEQTAVVRAVARLSDRDRDMLLAHEVSGQGTRSLAEESGSSAGAVAAQLNRTRARLRVEYLLEAEGNEPPTDRCRTVLLTLSSGDRRRQREVDADRHVLECPLCARLSQPLLERGQPRDDVVRVPIRTDSDIVAARRAAREMAAGQGFSRTDLTVIATAVSEIARNIVRFTDGGMVVIELLGRPDPGVRIVALDTGPGIADVERALVDGYSTYDGLGLGLPGARRLMDEFAVSSEVGRGTTVTMTKLRRGGRP
jgi:serine/threonine-protein kinase RsbT